jgi:predicted GTPase
MTAGDERINCIIMGAAGRDFHNFLIWFRDRPQWRVCAFTAAQIPFIETRTFPRALAGPNYPDDIPIFPEQELPELIRRFDVDVVFFAYSDLSHEEVMHRASLVQSCGAAFAILGPRQTQLQARRPVVAVTAVRTGAGKSPLCQWLASRLQAAGRRVGVMRHPMPYGDLTRQQVEHFKVAADLDRFACTIEEREEYTPYLEAGIDVYAGCDYEQILRQAETASDVILWDGGNNDTPFVRPDLLIVVADALRPGHEIRYFPGETNLRMADVVVINKAAQADTASLSLIESHVRELNPEAVVLRSDLEIDVDDSGQIRGRRVLVVEDGPTITHGGMSHGAGLVAVQRSAPTEIIDPRLFAVGTLQTVYDAYPHIGPVLPACGYSDEQVRDLVETIRIAAPELIVDASPARLQQLTVLPAPCVRVRYRFQQLDGPDLLPLVLSKVAACTT